MKKKLFAVLSAATLTLGLAACSSDSSNDTAGESGSSDYPKNNITIVAPSGAGGGWDLTARSIAKIMNDTKLIEKAITVENKPGGGGAVFMANLLQKK